MQNVRRRLWLSRRLWRRRLVFWCGALAAGLISVLFAEAANAAQSYFRVAWTWFWPLPLLLTPAGFVLCAWVGSRYFPGAQGSGIPQAIAARHLPNPADRHRLLGAKLIIGKIGLTVIGLLCGASAGREGPTVQVGATIMLKAARIGRLRNERGLILAGSAAGIAAAFNAPLAGIVFAIEEMSRSFEARTNGLVLYAVIIAGLVSLGLTGNYTYFGATSATVASPHDWVLTVAAGIIGGLLGGAFSRALLEGAAQLRRLAPARTYLVPAICGLAVALCGLLTGGATFGTGYTQARALVEGHSLGFAFWPAKLIATLATALSGIPGGIFAPSLAAGAGLGAWLAGISGEPISLGAVLGMAGYFAGVVQAPMTAFVIILEMTGNNSNVIPLMAAAVLGFGSSKLIAPEPLYHGLAKQFLGQ